MILYRQASGKGNVNSLVQIADGVCCPDGGEVCQFVASVTKATVGAITAFSVKDKDGVTVKTTVSSAGNARSLRENLVAAINAAGGRLFNGGITITDDGTNYNISGIGEVVLVSYSKGGSDTTFTKNCTNAYQCVHSFYLFDGVAGANNLTVGGTTTSLGAVTYPSTTAASLKTTVTGIAGVVGASSDVVADALRRGYLVTVAVDSQVGVFLNGESAFDISCKPLFTT